MKKITIALLSGLLSINGWSACTYSLDASLTQINKATGKEAPNISLFPQNSNQKIGLTLQQGLPVGELRMNIATSSTFAKNIIAKLNDNPTSQEIGDQSLPANGIVAFEFNFKVPHQLSNKGQLVTFPIVASGNMDDGKVFSLNTFYANNTNSTGGDYHGFFFMFVAEGTTQVELNNLSGSSVSNSTNLQKIGFYINQSSNQIGLIMNGVNHGYVYTLPNKAKNIGFMFNAMYQNIDTVDVNKEFSIEMVTDATKISQAYPTGAKDICGNII